MIRLVKSDVLGRKIRQDDPEALGISNWALVDEAIKAGRTEEALEFVEYGCEQDKETHDSLVAFIDILLTHIASKDEKQVEQIVRLRGMPKVKAWLSVTPGVIESLQRCTEFQRRHYADFTVSEEPERFVVRCDPGGSGGRLRRTRNVGATKKAYPWSWGKIGVPYYCIHCCLQWEIIPTELRGYPIRVTLPGGSPEDPCVHLFYKRPELIPEEYFVRVGTIKGSSGEFRR
jgi:hypothetical protein